MGRRVITIGRQYGSNGHDIAKKLSQRLGIHYYDKELIKIAGERQHISYEELLKVDEKRANPWRYPVEDEVQMERKFRFEPMNDVLFYTQAEIIKGLAEKEDCIIVGRCADEILKGKKGCRSVFIHAPFEKRVERIMERASIDEREAAALIKKIDKQRRYYYNYFTDKKWEDMTQYDICLDSGSMPEEQILDVLAALYESIL
ncbi:cytidylate kinase-like family protein [Faecalicatena contorta]|jgi:CMP/dCMP kinase|uniref:cytidylate kinase-like family protein n=1 Tax=Faecalicatena contorta TaxID=39482 RepID=UPI00129EA6BE|nr:cytidylate kinase-like family protein [Faecalicatena contorta]MEE0202700.1 cytidylate kinase-like family protein [Muricomes sp.]MRM87901.1 cytidylate kinase-like family protein [Faecalicatena contorta]